MIEIIATAIDIERVYAAVEDHGAGGVALFLGRVRDHADGHQVERMTYEGYESMAEKQLLKLAANVKKRWPIQKIAMVHRLGELELGDISVAVAVASAHRSEAFEACRYAIDTLKETLPIWKREFGEDGESWVDGVVPRPLDPEEDVN